MIAAVDVERAARVGAALSSCCGMLHAVRATMVVWDRSPLAENAIAAKYSFQMTYGMMLLTLRKFLDLWDYHLLALLPKDSDAIAAGQALVDDTKRRRIRPAANLVVAHYAETKAGIPLDDAAVVETLIHNDFADEAAVQAFIGDCIDQLFAMRDGLYEAHRVPNERRR
jgi:hypothetical protein